MFERYAARVAIVGPFSGPRAAWGRLLTGAIGLADRGVRWVLRDDRGDPCQAQRRADEIVLDGGYSAVLGHFNSHGARAALPRYRDAGIACMLPLATQPGLTSLAGGLVLRWCCTDGAQAGTLLRALAAAGHASVDVVTDGTAQMEALAGELLTAGVERVSARVLRRDRPPHKKAGAVVVVAAHHEAATMARELRTRGFRGQLAFTDDCAVAEFAGLAGEAAAGALVTVQPGGAASRVNLAITALAGALTADPSLTGRRLVAAVRERAAAFTPAVAFTPAGEVASDGWTVRQLPEPAAPLAA